MPKYTAVYKTASQNHGSPIMESMSLDAVKTQTRMFLASKGHDGDCVIVYMVGTGYRANYYYIVRTDKSEILECRSNDKASMEFIRPYTASAMPKADKSGKPISHRDCHSDAPVTFLGVAAQLNASPEPAKMPSYQTEL